ncbi:MAG: thiamine diphosphokinase [Bacteroidales bacterium]|nr:thiamine diphosphokinase [Bacteroidales bacterium]
MKRKNIIIVCDGDFPTAKQPLKVLRDAVGKSTAGKNAADKDATCKCNGIIIACDGTAVNLAKHGFTPDYIVGDMDTLSAANQKKYKNLIHKNSSRENNDQTKAFEFALKLIREEVKAAAAKSVAAKSIAATSTLQTQYKIFIIGATGKREDHTLGNISLLADYAEILKKKFSAKATADKRKFVTQKCDPNNITVEMITDYGIFTPFTDSFKISARKGEQISFFAFDPTLCIKSEGLVYPLDSVKFDMWWKATLNEFAPCNNVKAAAGNRKAAARGSKTIAELKFNHPAKVLVFREF